MQQTLSDEWSSKGSSIGRKQIVHECCSGLSWPLAISRRKAAAVSSAACTGLLALPFSDEPFSVPSIPRLLPSFGSSDILRGRGRYLLGRGLGGWLGVHYQPGASCTTGKTADWRVVPQQQRQRQRQQQGCRSASLLSSSQKMRTFLLDFSRRLIGLSLLSPRHEKWKLGWAERNNQTMDRAKWQ